MLPMANTQLKVVRSDAEGMLEYAIASAPQRIMPSRMHATKKETNRFNTRISLSPNVHHWSDEMIFNATASNPFSSTSFGSKIARDINSQVTIPVHPVW
jgi:hypothetical protein